MNIWDSVQRGLEKASQEAARIARMQKLRSTVDSLSRQITTQNNTLLNRAMDLYASGQLTQSELIPLCQELTILRQQHEQAYNELKALQHQGPAAPTMPPRPGTTPAPSPYSTQVPPPPTAYTSSGEVAPTLYAPPPTPPSGFSTVESTMPVPAPPPPPGMESPTLSTQETSLMNEGSSIPPPPAIGSTVLCPNCRTELPDRTLYCPRCGNRVQASGADHLPTMRGEMPGPPSPADQETVRAQPALPIDQQNTIYTGNSPSTPVPIDQQATIRGDAPGTPAHPQSKDGGD
jgi:hypothetical protein